MARSKITKIIRIEEKKDKLEQVYYRTYAIVEQTEVMGYSIDPNEYNIGDVVNTYHDDKYNMNKMEK